MKYLKATLNLPVFPVINNWIEYEYSKVKSDEELADFIYKAMTEAEENPNKAARKSWKIVASYLYGYYLNRSYQSKI